MTTSPEQCAIDVFCGNAPTSYKLGTPIAFENLAVVPLALKNRAKPHV